MKKSSIKPTITWDFFSADDWQMDDTIISYGHDIEAAMAAPILRESTGMIDAHHATCKKKCPPDSRSCHGRYWMLTVVCGMNTITADKGTYREKHWWPQAEALVGFCNAWQLTATKFRIALLKNWKFINNEMLDHVSWRMVLGAGFVIKGK